MEVGVNQPYNFCFIRAGWGGVAGTKPENFINAMLLGGGDGCYEWVRFGVCVQYSNTIRNCNFAELGLGVACKFLQIEVFRLFYKVRAGWGGGGGPTQLQPPNDPDQLGGRSPTQHP